MNYLNNFANRWIFSTNHKDIGSFYIIFSLGAGFLGGLLVMSNFYYKVYLEKNHSLVGFNQANTSKINYVYCSSILLVADTAVISNELQFLISFFFLCYIIKLIWNSLKKLEEKTIESALFPCLLIYLFSFLSLVLYFFLEINLIMELTLKISLLNLAYWIILLKYLLLNKTPEFGKLQYWIITKYRRQLLAVAMTNILGFYNSGYSVITSLFASLVMVSFLTVTLEKKDAMQDLFFYQWHFASILSYSLMKIGKIDWGFLAILILIATWVLPIFFSLTEFSKEERDLKGEIDATEVNLRNKIISQLVWLNLTIKNCLNNFQKDTISTLSYLLYLLGFFLLLPRLVGPVIASSIYIAFISNDFSSKIAVKRVIANNSYYDLLVNNLPSIQKRHMKKVTEAVIEFAAQNPGKTMTVAGGVLTGVVAFIANAHQVAASDRAAEASDRASEASLEESKSLKEYTAEAKETRLEAKEARLDENKKEAMEKLVKGVTTESYKEDLVTMAKSGEIPETMTENLLAELEANKDKK